jgi:hypothetical protein
MYSVEHCVFNALVATSFGRYNYHQANAIQNLKRLVTYSAYNVKSAKSSSSLLAQLFIKSVSLYGT